MGNFISNNLLLAAELTFGGPRRFQSGVGNQLPGRDLSARACGTSCDVTEDGPSRSAPELGPFRLRYPFSRASGGDGAANATRWVIQPLSGRRRCPSNQTMSRKGRVLGMEQEQPARVGRRLAAIVAADVAGYSRLMGLEEVGTARTLREHRKVTDALVAKHGGRLVKTTGDGVLLEFPSVVDTVECAGRAGGDGPEERRGAR